MIFLSGIFSGFFRFLRKIKMRKKCDHLIKIAKRQLAQFFLVLKKYFIFRTDPIWTTMETLIILAHIEP